MATREADTLALKNKKNELVSSFVGRNDLRAAAQTLNTLIPVVLLTYAGVVSMEVSYLLTAGIIALLTLFLLRSFVLLHDCGHNCMYSSPRANSVVGFIFGVFCGMPQYVWSRHHDYHHSTNGNWNKYRGPLAVLSTEEYAKLTDKQKRGYANQRKLYMGPLAGFLYFVFNPRITWIKGLIALAKHVMKGGKASEFKTPYWETWKEFRHITGNNLVLLTICTLATIQLGGGFLFVYVTALSLAGASGIILFTVQHNFEGSYASGDEGWDYYTAALAGTSYLKLPRVLDWFTADIGYHHIHHLSARIPNYNLRACHHKYQDLFRNVPRLGLKDVPHSMQYIIWDESRSTLITPAQFEADYSTNAEPVATEAA